MTKNRFKIALVSTALLLGVVQSSAAAAAAALANAQSAFRFSGACEDCYDGAGFGTGTLVLRNYQLGDAIDRSNFVSFTYDGTDLISAFTVTADDEINVGGSIKGPLPGTENFSFLGRSFMAFVSDEGGSWCVGTSCSSDYGRHHQWSQIAAASDVPEPRGWTMLIAGFGVVGGAIRRRRADLHIA